MKILSFTSLYPNSQQDRHGIFVENRLIKYQQAFPEDQIKVVAPVTWFPFKNARFGQYAKYAQIAADEKRSGVEVFHPRYFMIPKIGVNHQPWLMYKATLPLLKKIIADGYDFDVIDSHYVYPDGVAAVLLAKALNKPVTMTARGNDLSLLPSYPKPKKWIQWALKEADAVFGVCQALCDQAKALQPLQDNIFALRNGVDLEKFKPADNRDELRKHYGMTGKSIVSVGHLIERKGHHLVIEALKHVEDIRLWIAGDGEEQQNLQQLIKQHGLEDRVTMLGALPPSKIPKLCAAADALVLASSREGWANVLLESMACGTPVVATAIWGTPEVVQAPEAGVLVHERSARGIAKGVEQLFTHYPESSQTRAYAEKFGWDETVKAMNKHFRDVVDSQ